MKYRTVLAVALSAIALSSASVSAQQDPVDPVDPVELEGLVVTATPIPVSRSALGSHVTVLDAGELLDQGVVRVVDALREVPGLSIAENGSMGSVTSVFMRGGESDYVQVLVDGVQVNQPGGSFNFAGLELASVERIEIVRGPASALHGSDAVAGVIHIITRDGSGGTPSSLSFRAGNFGRLDGTLSVNGGDERASYGVSLARFSTDGILDFNNRHRNTVLNGKAAFRLDDRTRARIAGRFTDRQYNFPTDFTGAVVDENQFTFNDESTLSLQLERTVTDRIELRALVSAYAVDSGTDDVADGPADTLGLFGFQSLDAYRRRAVDLRASVELARGLTATLGGEYEEQEIRSFNESSSAFGASTGRSDNARLNRAGYLHLTGERGSLAANAGVRLEDNEFFGDFLSWQAGASWTALPGLRLRAAAGRGIKEPTFFETFANGFVVGNPALEPEVSTSVEAGAEWSLLDRRLELQATVFRQEFEDLIQYTGTPPQPGDPNYFNVAGARSSGLEAGAALRLGPARIGGDVTWLDTEVTDAGFAQGSGATFVEGEPLLRRPEITVGVHGSWDVLDGLRLGGRVQRVGTRADRNFNAFPAEPVELEAYTRLDAFATWQVVTAVAGRPGLELTLESRNLNDAAYQDVFGFDAPGRMVTVSGRVSVAR